MGSNAVFIDLICDQRREGRRGDRNELALFARKTGLKRGIEKAVLGELSLSLIQKGDGVDKHLIKYKRKPSELVMFTSAFNTQRASLLFRSSDTHSTAAGGIYYFGGSRRQVG